MSKRRIESDKYDVIALDNSHGLAMYCYTHDNSLDGARYAIDESNKQAVKAGYKAKQWLIIHQEYYAWYDENGCFEKDETYRTAVEIYPETLK